MDKKRKERIHKLLTMPHGKYAKEKNAELKAESTPLEDLEVMVKCKIKKIVKEVCATRSYAQGCKEYDTYGKSWMPKSYITIDSTEAVKQVEFPLILPFRKGDQLRVYINVAEKVEGVNPNPNDRLSHAPTFYKRRPFRKKEIATKVELIEKGKVVDWYRVK